MPFRFIFHIDDEHVFEAHLISAQCVANCKSGRRCLHRVVIGLPYCYVHLLTIKHLRIKKSNIPNAGLGLFVEDKTKAIGDVIYKKDSIIAEYTGQIINKQTLEDRYGNKTAPYALRVSDDRYIDAALERSFMSIANGYRTKAPCNAQFANPAPRTKRINVKALKSIRNGDEILLWYGNEYQFQGNHSTQRKK